MNLVCSSGGTCRPGCFLSFLSKSRYLPATSSSRAFPHLGRSARLLPSLSLSRCFDTLLPERRLPSRVLLGSFLPRPSLGRFARLCPFEPSPPLLLETTTPLLMARSRSTRPRSSLGGSRPRSCPSWLSLTSRGSWSSVREDLVSDRLESSTTLVRPCVSLTIRLSEVDSCWVHV